jgi:flagellar biosynthesis chaperone FliJ
MKKMDEVIKEVDAQLQTLHEEYIELHNQLDKHRGKPLGETNLVEVNQLLKDIQSKFGEMYPVFHFIGHRYQFVTNSTNHYSDFIDQLKKSGATENGKDQPAS